MGEGGREEGRDGQFTRNLPIYSSLGLKKGSFRLDDRLIATNCLLKKVTGSRHSWVVCLSNDRCRRPFNKRRWSWPLSVSLSPKGGEKGFGNVSSSAPLSLYSEHTWLCGVDDWVWNTNGLYTGIRAVHLKASLISLQWRTEEQWHHCPTVCRFFTIMVHFLFLAIFFFGITSYIIYKF